VVDGLPRGSRAADRSPTSTQGAPTTIHEVVPVLNKGRTCRPAEPEAGPPSRIEDVIGLDASDAILISAEDRAQRPPEVLGSHHPHPAGRPPKGDRANANPQGGCSSTAGTDAVFLGRGRAVCASSTACSRRGQAYP